MNHLLATCQRVFPSREEAERAIRAYVAQHGVTRLHALLTEGSPWRASRDDAKAVAAMLVLSAYGVESTEFMALLRV